MQPVLELLWELRQRGIEVGAVTEGRLRVHPASALTEDQRAQIQRYKPCLLTLLGSGATLDRVLPNVATQRRVARLLRGRLWHDGDGWWPRDLDIPADRARELSLTALTSSPDGEFPQPSVLLAARGERAVRSAKQIAAMLATEVGWSLDRAWAAATLIASGARDDDDEPARGIGEERALHRDAAGRKDSWPTQTAVIALVEDDEPPAHCFNCRRSLGWWRVQGDPGPWHCENCVAAPTRIDLDVRSGTERAP